MFMCNLKFTLKKMESFVELGLLGLFVASFLSATILPMNSEIVLSVLLLNNYSLNTSLLVATFGNWLGGMTNYGLGFLGKWGVRRHPVPDVLHKFCGISGGFLTAQACNQIEGHIDPRRNTG